MAGRIIYSPESAHRCSGHHNPDNLRPGTIWECDHCSQRWVVVYGQGEDGKGYSAWRKLTHRNKDGQDL